MQGSEQRCGLVLQCRASAGWKIDWDHLSSQKDPAQPGPSLLCQSVCVCAQTLQMTVPDWGATIRQQSSQLRVKSTSQRSWYSVSSKVRDGVVHIFLVVLMIGDAATRKGSALDRPRFCCPAGASISSVARVACSSLGTETCLPGGLGFAKLTIWFNRMLQFEICIFDCSRPQTRPL